MLRLKGATLDEWDEWLTGVLQQRPIKPYGPREPEEQERYTLEAFQHAVHELKALERRGAPVRKVGKK